VMTEDRFVEMTGQYFENVGGQTPKTLEKIVPAKVQRYKRYKEVVWEVAAQGRLEGSAESAPEVDISVLNQAYVKICQNLRTTTSGRQIGKKETEEYNPDMLGGLLIKEITTIKKEWLDQYENDYDFVVYQRSSRQDDPKKFRVSKENNKRYLVAKVAPQKGRSAVQAYRYYMFPVPKNEFEFETYLHLDGFYNINFSENISPKPTQLTSIVPAELKVVEGEDKVFELMKSGTIS